MENKNPNDISSLQDPHSLEVQPDSVVYTPSQGATTLDSASVSLLTPEDQAPQKGHRLRRILLRPYLIWVVILLLAAGIAAFAFLQRDQKQDTNANSLSSGQFDSVKISLQELLTGKDLSLASGANVTINGTLQANNGLLLTPTLQPTGAKPGQIYYDQGTNQLAYFNGSNFVFLTGAQSGGVQSLGGATGQLVLGSGLTLTNNQLSNGGVLSIQGTDGAVTFTAGPGIVINGTNFSNSGVISISSDNPALTVSDDGAGNITLSMSGGTGSVTSGGGTAGTIPVFTADQNIEDSIITQAGLAVSIAGDLQITGALTLSTPLTVDQGGTGAATHTANGVLVGNGSAAVSSVAAGGVGLCLMSTAGAPAWGACPGGGGGGVSSLNGLTGAVSIANASAAGSTITLDDATTSSKGIASFNGTNFTVTGGAVNTIQDINTAATPNFAGVNTNNITPNGTLTVGAAAQQLVLQGNASTTLTAYSGANATIVDFETPTATVTYRFRAAAAGTYDICTTVGNCVGVGGAVTTSGGTANRLAKFTGGQAINDSTITDDGTTVTTSVDLIVQGGNVTIGAANAQTGSATFADGGSAFLGTIVQGALTANRTYTLPDASGTICLSSGNCPATGVTSLNGLVGSLNIANASGSGSTITIDNASTSAKGIASFNGTNFTVTGGAVNTAQDINAGASPTFAAVNTNTITPSSALTIGDTGLSLLLQGNASTLITANNGGNATTVSFQSPTADVTYRFLTAAAGTYDICTTIGNCAGSGGGVTTSGGTTNRLAKFSGAQAIADSSITDNGTNVLTSVDLVVQGGDLTVGVPTTQTGTINLANNGSGFLGSIIQGALSANRTYTLPDASGTICLSSGNCPATGVTSLNGLVGALSIANASASGSTITIDDASTTNKGIASFNSTNFTATSGAVNTIQNINAAATPTFAGVNTNSITPSGALTVGATTQTALLRGSITTITSSGTGNDIILTSADTIELQGTTNVTGNIDVSGTLTAGTGNAFQVAANGNITTSGTAVVTGASVTVGSTSLAGALVLNDGAGQTGTLNVASLGQATVYTLPDPGAASVQICLTSGNCAGSGGGVTTPGGTTNRLAKFSGSQSIADSTISDNGTNVTTSVDLIIQGGDVMIGVANSQTGTINFAHSASSFLGSILQGALTADRTYTLPDASGTVCLSSGNCSGSGSSNTLQASYDAGNTIATTDGRDIAFTLANTTTDANFTVDVATGGTGYVAFRRADGAGTADPAQLLLLDNLDTNRAQPTGLRIQSAGGGITTAIDLTDAEIATALSVAANDITGTTGDITYSNFSIDGATGDIVTSGTITSGTINGQTISSAANFTGDATIAGTLNVNTITPNAAMTIGDAGQTLTLQGGPSTSLTITSGANTSTLNFTVPTANRTISLPDESGTICLQSSTNCGFALSTGSGNYIQNQSASDQTASFRISGTGRANTSLQAPLFDTATAAVLNIGTTNATSITLAKNTTFSGDIAVNGGDITSSGALNITPGGTLNVGATGQQLVLQGNASTQLTATGGGFTTTVGFTGTPVGAVTYNFDRAVAAGTYSLCSTAGNCAGVGGGVTTSGGTTNRLAKFSGSQAIADSTISDNGTNVTTSVDLVIQGGDLTVGTSSQLASIILHDGNGQTTTLQAGDSSGALTFILPTNAGSATQCLKQSGTGNQLIWDSCDGGGGGTSATLQAAYNNGSTITTTDARDIDIVLADTTTDSLFDLAVADNSTGYFSLTRANGVGTADPAQLMLIDNLDTNRAVAAGIKLQAAGGGMTTAIDATDAEIVDAINVAANNIVGTTGNIDFTNFDVIGSTGSVTMAGNLSVTSGTITNSGNINTTGGGLQTNSTTRVDNSGNLTNIGNITGTGAITIASSGAGNDVIINGADVFDVQDATTFASTVGFNGVATFNSDLTANGNVTIGDTAADLLTITSVLQGGSPLTFEGATADAEELTLSVATLTTDRTITLPDETGTICLQSSTNCGFALSTGSGNYIQNQNSADQTADFRITGTGRAGALQALSLDTATASAILTIGGTNAGTVNIANNAAAHTVNIATASGAAQTVAIGSSNATSTVTVQGGTGASAVSIQGGASATISIGTVASNTITVGNASTTATLTLGQSTASNTINIGNATTATGNTQTINIGTSATGTGKAVVTIGNTNAASAVNIQAGTGNVNLTTNASTASVIAKSSANSAVAFQVQNSSSVSLFTVDTIGSNVSVLANNSSTLGTWTATTAMSIGTSTTRVRGGAVAANGYLYQIGGVDGGAVTLTTVQYAKLNADGTVGTWASTTALPDGRKQFQPVVLNGYLYVIGGRNNSNTLQTTTYYAKLNTDGTVGTWNTATALPAARFGGGTIAYNGYLYYLGGLNSGFTSQTTVYGIKANPDGTLASAWTTPTALPVGLASSNGIVANGYVYMVGGFTTGYEDDIYYAKLNTDGTLGSWTTLSGVLNATGGGDENFQSFVANGYLYAVGGDLGNRVVSFALGGDGSLGAGSALTSLPISPMGEAAGASANGYFYLLGGSTGSDGGGTARNTVYYTTGSRVKVGGNLDLIGYTGENLAEGRSGGQLTAGNTTIVGTFQVQDSASFAREVNIDGTLHASSDTAIGGNLNLVATSATAGAINQGGSRWIHSAGSATNFFAGQNSGNLTTTGTDNVGIGANVLQSITTGSSNVAIGSGAGLTSTPANANTTGGNNVYIGYNAGPGTTTQLSNTTALGSNAIVTQNDTVIIGCIAGSNNCTTSPNIGIGTTTPDQALQIDRGAAKSHIHITNNATGHTTTDGYFLGLDSIGSGYVLNYMNMPMYIGVNGSPQITIRPTTGNVGISNQSAGYLLHVGSSSVTSGTSVARFENAGGTCTVTPNTAGGITCTSDIRRKKNIQGYSGALDVINQIDVKQYNMLADADGTPQQIGVIAQQLEKVVPSLVNTDKEGYKSVSYSGLTPILLQAIKEQQKQINDLKKEVDNTRHAGGFGSVSGNNWLDQKVIVLLVGLAVLVIVSVVLRRGSVRFRSLRKGLAVTKG
jgi:hypothetical protein